MPEPPEMLESFATPAMILERLDVLRMRYQMGAMDARSFNEVLKSFQFRDAADVLWTPGVQSGTWYRWDGARWTPGSPPDRLRLPKAELSISPDPAPQELSKWAPRDPDTRICPKCGAENVGKKFCTQCGTKLV